MRFSTLTWLAFLLSFCSFSYEMLFAKTLTLFHENHVLWQSVAIGMYVLGLGIGTFFADFTNKAKALQHLIRIELVLCLLGALSVFILFTVNGSFQIKMQDQAMVKAQNHQDFINNTPQGEHLFKLAQYDKENESDAPRIYILIGMQILVLLIGILSGFEIPLLIRLAEHNGHDNKDYMLLGIGHFGTLLAALVFSFYLFSHHIVLTSGLFIAAINGMLCLFLIIRYSGSLRRFYKLCTITSLGLILALTAFAPVFYDYYLRLYYYYRIEAGLRTPIPTSSLIAFLESRPHISHTRSQYQTIDFVHNPIASRHEEFALFLDQQEQFTTHNESYYHEGMAHAPMWMARKIPANILVLGAGDGILIKELLSQGKKVESITHIELDPEMLEIANSDPRLLNLNKGALNSPKVHTQTGDGFYFLRNSNTLYDAIYVDFPYPNSNDLARLYSAEFYHYVAKRLKPNGFAVIDSPILEAAEIASSGKKMAAAMQDDNNVQVNTVKSAGFKVIPYAMEQNTFFILYKDNPLLDRWQHGGQYFRFESPRDGKLKYVEIIDVKHQINDYHIHSIFRPRQP